MDRWAGKVAVVTGASSGIGEAVAKELFKNGLKVAALARRTEKLKELEKQLNKDGFIKGITCDVTKADEVKVAFNWIETNWGEINVLVNSAGVNIHEPLIGGTGEGMSKVFETNVIALSTCTREAIAVMKRHNVKQGHIININSILGHLPGIPGEGPYIASKHAVTVLTETLKNELAYERSNIRVTSISPGFVITEMSKPYLHLGLPKIHPEEISNCVTFVLNTPPNVNISELTVQPTGEMFHLTARPHTQKSN